MTWRMMRLTVAIYLSARVLGRSLIEYGRELEVEENQLLRARIARLEQDLDDAVNAIVDTYEKP